MVEDVVHRLDVGGLGTGDQESVARKRLFQLVADVSAVLKSKFNVVRYLETIAFEYTRTTANVKTV